MSDTVTWVVLATEGGCLAMVLMLTQLTKNIRFINKLPTQLWSYILALIVLYPALYFTGQLSFDAGVLVIFNAVGISFAANGAYQAANGRFGLKDS